MNFLNDLRTNIRKGVQSVSPEVKGKAEGIKLTTAIKELQTKEERVKYEIGKKYLELHPDSFEPEFEEYYKQLFECEKAIEEFRKKLKELKGECCPNCGAKIEDGALFCTECGCELLKEETNG